MNDTGYLLLKNPGKIPVIGIKNRVQFDHHPPPSQAKQEN